MPSYRKKTSPICIQWNKMGDHPNVVPVPPGVPSNALDPGADVTLCGFILDNSLTNGGTAIHPGDWIIDEPDNDRFLILSNEEFLKEYEEIKEKEDDDVDDDLSKKPSKFHSTKVSGTKK